MASRSRVVFLRGHMKPLGIPVPHLVENGKLPAKNMRKGKGTWGYLKTPIVEQMINRGIIKKTGKLRASSDFHPTFLKFGCSCLVTGHAGDVALCAKRNVIDGERIQRMSGRLTCIDTYTGQVNFCQRMTRCECGACQPCSSWLPAQHVFVLQWSFPRASQPYSHRVVATDHYRPTIVAAVAEAEGIRRNKT